MKDIWVITREEANVIAFALYEATQKPSLSFQEIDELNKLKAAFIFADRIEIK